MSIAVELTGVTKRFGQVVAVDAIDLSIGTGELVTLLGPSGCGKTTTLRMIAGLEMATEGSLHIAGVDVTRLPATRRDVSMVFQSYALFPHLSVLDNVAYGLVTSGRPRAEAEAKAQEGLSLVGLEGFGDRLPSALSGGQQQRVAVARALVLEPAVLLFDEPLSNLDARLRRRMREDIRRLQQEIGFTAVYVTHDQEEALSVSDRIVLMKDGRIAQAGPPRALYERPDSGFVATFIGDSNVLDAEVLDDGRVRIGEVALPLADVARPDPGLRGAARLAVRPHGFAFADHGLRGRVTSAAYLGDHMEYMVQTAAGAVFMVDPDTVTPRAVGDEVALAVRPHAAALVTT